MGSPLTRRALLGGGAATLAGSVLAAAGLGWGVLHPRGDQVVAQVGLTPTPQPPQSAEVPTSPAASSPQPEAQPSSTEPPSTATTESVPTATELPPAPTPPAPSPALEPTQAASPLPAQPTLEPTQASTPTLIQPTAEPTHAVIEPTIRPTQVATPLPAKPTPKPTQVVGRKLLAAPGDVGVGEALDFTLPSGQPAVLVHNAGGYSAYVSICPHQGCTVHISTGGVLRCPCHGAQFDSAAGAKVLRGPAKRPLSPVAITVSADGSVYLAG